MVMLNRFSNSFFTKALLSSIPGENSYTLNTLYAKFLLGSSATVDQSIVWFDFFSFMNGKISRIITNIKNIMDLIIFNPIVR